MFMQMKSRSRSGSPCPCNGLCLCHKRDPHADTKAIVAGIFAVFLLVGSFTALGYYKQQHLSPVRYIEVNGQRCTIEYHVDVAVPVRHGHDVAVCPKDKHGE